MGERINALWDRIAELQERLAGRFALVGLAIFALSLPPILALDIDTRWTALLPEHAESVQSYEEAQERIGDLRTLVVAIESLEGDVEALKRAAEAVHTRLSESDSEHIGEIESNVREQLEFVNRHRHLYVDVDELRTIRDAADEATHSGASIEPIQASVQRLLDDAQHELARYPDGYFISEDETLLAIFVRAERSFEDTDALGRRQLLTDVRSIVDTIDLSELGDDLSIAFAGDVMLEIEEKEAVARELFVATGVTVVFVSMALLFFFRRMRAIALLGMALLPPVALTFAFAEVMVDSLNTSTAFLASIVIGNGINPNIMWLSGYFEYRRGGRDVLDSIRATHRSVWIGTLTASLAASLAYASLGLTDFRGFHDFGLIGAFGMAACWIGSGVLLPAWIVVFERAQPLKFGFDASAGKSFISVASARLVRTRPLTVLFGSLLVTVVALGFVANAITEETLEYDFQRLTSDRSEQGRTLAIDERVQAILGTRGGITLAAPSEADARIVEADLEAVAREEGRNAMWQPEVHSLFDYVPDDQDEKDALWSELSAQLHDLAARSNDDAALDALLPPEELERIDIDALPERIARPFTERDGSRGRLLRVDATRSLQDGRYLMTWSQAQRDVAGDDVLIASLGTVFADVVAATLRDGPRAMALALLATILICLFAFPRLRDRLLTVLSLLLGVVWMAGTLAATGFKLNFLNFVAFPITFGNGADYGINVMRRFEQERSGEARDAVSKAIERTGGAVSLCSLTTIIGYSSLYISANFAIKSFGLAMAVSEITCLLAAVLTMPAVLVLLARKDRS